METIDFKRASYTFHVDLDEDGFVVSNNSDNGDISMSCSAVAESAPQLFFSDRPLGKVVSIEKREINLPCEIKPVSSLVYRPSKSTEPENAVATLIDSCICISCFNSTTYQEILMVLKQAVSNDTLQLKITLNDCWVTKNGQYVLFDSEFYQCQIELRVFRSLSNAKNITKKLFVKLDRFEDQLRYLGSTIYNYITYGKDSEGAEESKDNALEKIQEEISDVKQAIVELNNTVGEIADVADRQLSIINNTYRTNFFLMMILLVLVYIGYRLS